MAAVKEDEYSSDDDMFRWMGNNDGLDFGAPLGSSDKSNPFFLKFTPTCTMY